MRLLFLIIKRLFPSGKGTWIYTKFQAISCLYDFFLTTEETEKKQRKQRVLTVFIINSLNSISHFSNIEI